MANYREPQWLLPNEKNLAMPASDATVGSGLAEDRQSLYSMNFDAASSDYIDCGDNDLLSFGNASSDSPFTVSSWIYAKGSSTFPFFDKYPDAGTWALREYRMEVFGTDKVVLIIYDGSAGARHEIYSDSVITRDQWQHVVITYDGRGGADAGDGVKIYINGSESTTIINSYGTYVAMENTTTPVRIGRVGGTYADGKIDETAVWNKALSASEVSALATASAPANILALSDKPIAYWPLGEQARLGSQWQFPNEVLQSQVFDFDGVNDYIDIGNLQPSTTSLSISAWAYKPDTTQGSIIGNGASVDYGIFVYGGSLQFGLNAGGWTTIATTLPTNQWFHVLGTWDGSTMKLYVNGTLASSTSKTGTITYTSNDTTIGKNSTLGGFEWNGKISNVALWGSDQSANIANIYNNGSPQSSYTTTPTAWYKLNATSNYAGLNPNFHNALSFDGIGDYIDTGASSFSGLTEMSVSAWVKPTATGTGAAEAILSTEAASPNRGFYLSLFVGSEYRWQVSTDGSNKDSLDAGVIVLNKWTHIAATWNQSTMNLYINGVLVDTMSTVNATGTFSTTNNMFIGQRTSGAGYFPGDVSNVALFNQAISAEDVKYLYNGGTPQTSLSFEPLSWWKLDNLTTGIQDSGSGGNDGTNNGATEVASNVAVDQWNFDNVSQAQTPDWSSALNFTGSIGNEHLEAMSSANLIMQGSHSFSCWLNTGTTSDATNYIFDKGTLDYSLGFTSNSLRLIYYNYQGGGGSNTILTLDSDWLTNYAQSWHHIIVTVDQPNLLVKLYVDGQLIGAPAALPADYLAPDNGTGNLNIMSYTGSTLSLSGQLSNLAFFNGTVLQQSDIDTIYNNGMPELVLSGSPTSWWKINNTGTGLVDNAGSDDLTNTGATEIQTNVWTPRLNGESTTLPSTALVSSDLQFESPYSNFSLDFDGTDDYIQVDNFESTNNIDTCSYSAWVNIDSSATGVRGIFGKGKSGANFEFNVRYYTAGTNLFIIQIDGTTVFENSSLSLSNNTWHHIAVVIDRNLSAGSNIKLFVDSVEIANSASVSFAQFTSTGYPLYIGAEADTATSTRFEWYGNIDEVAIWNTALTQAQVSQVYNNGYPADLTSLSPINWWRLGEDAWFDGSDFIIPNQITGAPNGTSQNMDQADLVADAPGSYASGVGDSLVVGDRIGDAPESTANSLSINMVPGNRISYPAGYVPTQVDNVDSMDFNGLDGYYNISPSSDFTFGTNGFAISMWVKRLTSGISYPYLIDFRDSEPESTLAFYYNESNGKLECWINGVAVISNSSGTKTLPLNDWAHVVLTREGTTLSTFVDGELDQSVTNSSNLISTTSINVGRRYNSVNYFEGNIDEVAIFNYGLSARQIKQDIYEGTTTDKTADLNNISNLTAPVAWYRMGD